MPSVVHYRGLNRWESCFSKAYPETSHRKQYLIKQSPFRFSPSALSIVTVSIGLPRSWPLWKSSPFSFRDVPAPRPVFIVKRTYISQTFIAVVTDAELRPCVHGSYHPLEFDLTANGTFPAIDF